MALNLYQPIGEKNKTRVEIVVRIDLIEKLGIENQTELVKHLYILGTNVQEMDTILIRADKKTRLANKYDNKVGERCKKKGNREKTRRIIRDIL